MAVNVLIPVDCQEHGAYFYCVLQRHTDWEAAAGLLKGIYETLARYPYIVHMQHLKTLINTCQVMFIKFLDFKRISAKTG
jgi:hypothetical protein